MWFLLVMTAGVLSGLKIAGAVTWSWWIVLMPIWVPFAVGITIILIMLLIGWVVSKVQGEQ